MDPARTQPSGIGPVAPPRRWSPASVIVLVIGNVAVVGIGFGLWVAANSRPPASCHGVGVLVSRSADGLTWNLTITSVPTGLTPANTSLALTFPYRTVLRTGKSLSSLTGTTMPLEGSAGALYLRYHGQFPGSLHAADTVYIGTSISGPGTPTQGCEAMFLVSGSIRWEGTLE